MVRYPEASLGDRGEYVSGLRGLAGPREPSTSLRLSKQDDALCFIWKPCLQAFQRCSSGCKQPKNPNYNTLENNCPFSCNSVGRRAILNTSHQTHESYALHMWINLDYRTSLSN